MSYRDVIQKMIYIIVNPLIHGMVKVGITPNMDTATHAAESLCQRTIV